MDGSIDPVRDIEIINMELQLADLATIERGGKDREGGQKRCKGTREELAILITYFCY